MNQHDILDLNDVKLLVNTFYNQMRQHEILGPVFNERIADRWPEHLEKMYRFWQTVLLEEHTYFGTPFPPHAKLPVTSLHFEKWLELFHKTVNTLFMGKKAEEAKWRGSRMAEMFEWKIRHLNQV
jgi:hemoglobin